MEMIGQTLGISEIDSTRFSDKASVRCGKKKKARMTPWILVQQLVEMDFSLTDLGKTPRRLSL